MTTPPISGCKGLLRAAQLNRRQLLQVGMLGSAGLSLSELLRAEEFSSTKLPKTSAIILWMRGGPSQLELWDPKPLAPVEIRGEFGTIATTVPGIELGEHLPRSAALMEHWSIVRSLHHRPEDGPADHSTGDQICFTGYPAGRQPDVNIKPSVGSIVKRQFLGSERQLPDYVVIPRNIPGTEPAYLGTAAAPFETQADPADPRPFQVPNLERLANLELSRLQSRRELSAALDRMRVLAEPAMASVSEYDRQAFELLTGTATQQAFDLNSEPQTVRERYGLFQPYRSRVRAGGDAPNWPQRMLLARRLVEAGVRLVTVDCRWWDTHEDNFWALETGFLPRWDQGYTALLSDLRERGLLESTLVVAWGEMGRTPRVNAAAGRDHWPHAFSAALAGGGVRGGRVVGSSDAHAAAPKESPKTPQDVLATIYRHLGIDTSISYTDHAGRPHPVLPCGQPLDELF